MGCTWEKARRMILNKRGDASIRYERLSMFPGYIEEIVPILMESRRVDGDNGAGYVVCKAATLIHLPVAMALDIIEAFKLQYPDRIKRILMMYTRDVVEHPEYLARFISEYFETDLSLDILKACIVSDLLSEQYLDSIDNNAILDLFVKSPHRELIFKNESKALELLVHVARIRFEYITSSNYDPCDSGLFSCLDSGDRNMLRIFFPYIRGLCDEHRHKVVEGLVQEIEDSRDTDYLDEYVELYDMIHSEPCTDIPCDDESELTEFVHDPQNVHRVRIKPDVLVELDTLDAKYAEREDSMEVLYDNPALSQALDRIGSDTTDFYGRTLQEWLGIVFVWAKDEGHMDILIQELQDMTGKCTSGHFRRLINVMNGFLFNLEESRHDPSLKEQFFDQTNALIQAQPNADEIMADFPAKAVKYSAEVAKEIMREDMDWYELMQIRRLYLYGE